MPELPEVEVLRRSLEPHLVGDRILRVEVRARALREPLRRGALRRGAQGRMIAGLRRRGKYLLIDLEGGTTLLLHLGMSGRLTLVPAGIRREAHEHLAFHLASGRRLRFRDPRRFGLVLALATAGLDRDPHLAPLGLEPLAPGFSGPALRRLAAGRRAPIKSFLMDARRVVGVGNIYATESLHRAGIHPSRAAGALSAERWRRLARAVREVLRRAIRQGGTTLNDFADGQGRQGEFQVDLAVYGREGEPCPRCGAPVRRLVQSGRSTFYCPRCQR
jgi:formamidopyrimidine-DNA glycosylase